jgi:hypothetical protein
MNNGHGIWDEAMKKKRRKRKKRRRSRKKKRAGRIAFAFAVWFWGGTRGSDCGGGVSRRE